MGDLTITLTEEQEASIDRELAASGMGVDRAEYVRRLLAARIVAWDDSHRSQEFSNLDNSAKDTAIAAGKAAKQ